jgi:hypothetical protein
MIHGPLVNHPQPLKDACLCQVLTGLQLETVAISMLCIPGL